MKNKMTIDEAFAIFHCEHDADECLLLDFRLSNDVDPKRINAFLDALAVMEDYYTGRDMIEKNVAYKLMSFKSTLSVSAKYWTACRPEGLDIKTTSALVIALGSIFATR